MASQVIRCTGRIHGAFSRCHASLGEPQCRVTHGRIARGSAQKLHPPDGLLTWPDRFTGNCWVTSTIPPWFLGLSPLVVLLGGLVAFIILSLLLQLLYALAAIVAIYHDVLVTVGFLSLCEKEFDLQIIAALLTIIGYSLNDTIVIFDRIRENRRSQPSEQFAAVVNTSVNQTLSRTLLTTGYTLLVVVALFLLGGEVLHDFAFALLVGMIAGTYSTVFIATPLLVYSHAWTSSRAGRSPVRAVDPRQP